MGQESRVSVIMNCYNGEEYLREAIDSVYAQSYKNWEIIFWDNASTDGTSQIAQSYDSRLRYFRADVNTHLGPARNMALAKAKTTYIAFLDSDDWWMPNKLEVSLRYLERGADLVYHNLFIVTKLHQKFFWRIAPTRHLKSPVFDDLIIFIILSKFSTDTDKPIKICALSCAF